MTQFLIFTSKSRLGWTNKAAAQVYGIYDHRTECAEGSTRAGWGFGTMINSNQNSFLPKMSPQESGFFEICLQFFPESFTSCGNYCDFHLGSHQSLVNFNGSYGILIKQPTHCMKQAILRDTQVDLGNVGFELEKTRLTDLTCLTNRPYHCFLRRQAYNNMEDVWGTKSFGNVSSFMGI